MLSTSGTGVFKHYCGGKLATVSLFLPYNPCNMEENHEGCNDEIPSDCCKDQQNYYKVDADFSAASTDYQLKKFEIELGSFIQFEEFALKTVQSTLEYERGPPLFKRPPVYLLYHRLLLYA